MTSQRKVAIGIIAMLFVILSASCYDEETSAGWYGTHPVEDELAKCLIENSNHFRVKYRGNLNLGAGTFSNTDGASLGALAAVYAQMKCSHQAGSEEVSQVDKIVTLFERNHETDHRVRDEYAPGTEWVLRGEGRATVKLDGTCCMVRDGRLYKRHETRPERPVPEDFEAAGEVDPETGRQPGWVPVGDGPEDRWHRDAVKDGMPPDGTYELLGPRIQRNPEGYAEQVLIPHGATEIPAAPRDFEGLRAYLADGRIEGIVWHHPDGRMAKIKGRDFGIRRAKA